jgi:hypothetical protein
LFESALPELQAPARDIVSCVGHLYREAGNDLAASWIFKSYVVYLEKHPDRPQDAIATIEDNPEDFAELLTPTLVAGSRSDAGHYRTETLRLSVHDDLRIRRAALLSIGRLSWASDRGDSAVARLEEAISTESDDVALANVIRSIHELSKQGCIEEKPAAAAIGAALAKGDKYSLHAASEIFSREADAVRDASLDMVLNHLRDVRPENNLTVQNVDHGLASQLSSDNSEKALLLLEHLLLTASGDFSMDNFPACARAIIGDPQLTARIFTRWFLAGQKALCQAVQEIVEVNHGENDLLVQADSAVLGPDDSISIVFAARKAVGFLLMRPVTVASFLVSLISLSSDPHAVRELEGLLFNPVLLNYPRRARDFLEGQAKAEGGEVQATLERGIARIDAYLETLRSVGSLPALHPSQSHRDAFHRDMSVKMAESFKAAESRSVFMSLVTKNVLLYGRKSISHVRQADGQAQRIEFPLQTISSEIEMPRLHMIDPVGLDFACRVYRTQQQKQ